MARRVTSTVRHDAAAQHRGIDVHQLEDLLLIDGLLVSKWNQETVYAMQAAGLTAANCTCAVWENFEATMANVGAFKRLITENDHALSQVYTVADIVDAARDRRVGVILGFQNSSPIEGNLDYLRLFHELGVRVIQLAYNTLNFVGAGCYEQTDSGLSDFGRELVQGMNELGILVDLSHVGAQTARDAIAASDKPVAFTHVCPQALHQHPRNKTDEEIRLIANNGGVVGVTFLTWFLRAGRLSTLDDCLDAIEHVLNVAGEEHVAIGTDFTQGHDRRFLEWILRDKGTGRLLTNTPIDEIELAMPVGLKRIADLPNLVVAMERRGWAEARIRRVLGENWLRLFRDVWAGRRPPSADAMGADNSAAGA